MLDWRESLSERLVKKFSIGISSSEDTLMLKLAIWNKRKVMSRESSLTWVLKALTICSRWLRNHAIPKVLGCSFCFNGYEILALIRYCMGPGSKFWPYLHGAGGFCMCQKASQLKLPRWIMWLIWLKLNLKWSAKCVVNVWRCLSSAWWLANCNTSTKYP